MHASKIWSFYARVLSRYLFVPIVANLLRPLGCVYPLNRVGNDGRACWDSDHKSQVLAGLYMLLYYAISLHIGAIDEGHKGARILRDASVAAQMRQLRARTPSLTPPLFFFFFLLLVFRCSSVS